MRMSVEHHVNAVGGLHESVRPYTSGAYLLTEVRQYHYVVCSAFARRIHRVLHQPIGICRAQVINAMPFGIHEGVCLRAHSFRCGDTYESYLPAGKTFHHVWLIYCIFSTRLEEVHRCNRLLQFIQQFHHARHSIVKFMVAQCQCIVAHHAHYIGNVFSLRQRTCQCSLQEVTATYHCHVACVSLPDGVIQSLHVFIAIYGAVHIVFIQYNDTACACFLASIACFGTCSQQECHYGHKNPYHIIIPYLLFELWYIIFFSIDCKVMYFFLIYKIIVQKFFFTPPVTPPVFHP